MTTQLITTKLFIPSPPVQLVSRPRVLNRLEQGASGKLTLISAQAGSGKSTLLAEWIRQCGKPVCWLSLDEGDNDAQRFFKYFTAALRKVISDPGRRGLLTLESSQLRDIESLLTHLINEITAINQHFIFVLDDYHVITAPVIQQLLLFLLDHMPAQMHLIISSRSDPPWPLSRLRVRGEITEIRSQELRFTIEETGVYLRDLMGLALSQEEIAALDRRTEGWIAGLHLAAISMQQRPNKAAFIQAFTGSHRFVLDYLVEEVLDQQPADIQEFLLKTSILKRFTAALCDAVSDRQDSKKILGDLERMNLFLIPLDDERRWYRYHHLFQDLLRVHLKKGFAGEKADLHKKASEWYEQNDLLADAINHALAANELERIVQLTEDLTMLTLNLGELKVFLDWLERLPEPSIKRHPWLLVARAWAFFNLGKYEVVDATLADIQRILETERLPDELEKRIRGHAAAIRSYLAEFREDPQCAMLLAEEALAWLPDTDIKLRAFVAVRWANCLVWLGDLDRAIKAYQYAGEACQLVGDEQLAITALSEMAITLMISGKLRQAGTSITETSQYAERIAKRDGRQPPAMGILYRHISYINREKNELAEASLYAKEAIKICEEWGEKESYLFALMALARVQFAEGEFQQVVQSFQYITRVAGEISPLYVTQFKSMITGYQLLMGNAEEAERWVQEHSLTAGEPFGYERHQDYYIYARYLFKKGNYTSALEVIEALLKAVTHAGAGMHTIRYKVLQSIVLYKINRVDEAMAVMQDGLSMASAEGFVRSILDEGEGVGDLLRKAIAKGVEVDYAGKLLSALKAEGGEPGSQTLNDTGVAEALSQREMEVLRLLVTDLTTPEIADELVISASTVRSHIKSIYSKLDAHSRYEAVRKAQELNLL